MMGCGGSKAVQAGGGAPGKEPDPFYDLIMDESLARNEWPKKKMAESGKKEKKSLMVQAMSKELFDRLKDHKTATAGWTIARAINTGVMYPSSFVGCHAGDLESYTDFKDVRRALFFACVDFFSSFLFMLSLTFLRRLSPPPLPLSHLFFFLNCLK